MIRISITCDREGCDEEVSAPWPADEWWSVTHDQVTLDGHVEVDLAGWNVPGPRLPGQTPITLCPTHAEPVDV